MYEAKKAHPIHTFKAAVKLAASQAYAGAMIESAVKLTVLCVFPRPGRLIWKKRDMPRAPMIVKPDWDNIGKAVSDSLNGLLWRDDSQVCFALVTKEYAAGGEQAHVDVTIEIMA
jgi:Holliday junction resolvase RusA-like endonuclease